MRLSTCDFISTPSLPSPNKIIYPRMKSRRSLSLNPYAPDPSTPPLTRIYDSICEKMSVLDDLHKQYKSKQEERFFKVFMGTVQKMGNELITLREAYRKIDVQARTDEYCMSLAEELSFFKNESFCLKDICEQREKAVERGAQHTAALQAELAQVKQAHLNKTKQCLRLRQANQQLTKRLKLAKRPEPHIFQLTHPLPQHHSLSHHPNTSQTPSTPPKAQRVSKDFLPSTARNTASGHSPRHTSFRSRMNPTSHLPKRPPQPPTRRILPYEFNPQRNE